MNQHASGFKSYRFVLIIMTAIYCCFVLLYEANNVERGEAIIREHARVVSDDLWNYNTVGITEYLSLAAESDNYERLTVVNSNGEIYQEAITTATGPIEAVALKLQLTPRVLLIAPIEYEHNYIGWIEGVWIPQTLSVHITTLCVFALIFVIILLYQRASNENTRLERRVAERTEDLFRSNQKLKVEINERKAAEQALRANEEQFRALVENINDVIFAVDAKGQLTYISPLFSTWTGYPVKEVLGKKLSSFFHPEDDLHFEKWLNSKEKQIKEVSPFRIVVQDGSFLWVRISCRLKEENNNIVGLRGTLTDVTDTKKLEAQLLQAQKMEAVGTLAGGIAHDFNNLLTGVQGYVSLLQIETSGNTLATQYLDNIESFVHSGAGLTRQLLGFARGGKYEVQATNLNSLICKSSEIFSRTRKNVTMERDLAEDLWAAEVDEQQIEQVLINLYLNAWQAMDDNGKITIRSENYVVPDNTAANGSALPPGEYVRVQVEDNGVGMDDEVMKRIFDPFFTTKEVGRGTGLGLASSYGIIQNHGGNISVSSVKGEGTIFSLLLPASHGPIKEKTRNNSDSELITGGERILLIDDEAMVLELAAKLLQKLGYAVVTAPDGKKALEIVDNADIPLDLIILDMIMPNMGGGQVFDVVKKIRPEIRVLLSSGYSIDGEAQSIMARGCNGFIQKPFSLKELSKKVREVLESPDSL